MLIEPPKKAEKREPPHYYLDVIRFDPKSHNKNKKYKSENLEILNKKIRFIHPVLKNPDSIIDDETSKK